MRVVVGEPGYRPGWNCSLDGVEVDGRGADSEEGWVDCLVRDASGRAVVSMGMPAFERRYGVVRLWREIGSGQAVALDDFVSEMVSELAR